MRKVSKEELEDKKLKIKQRKERKESLQKEIKTTPVPGGVKGLQERVSKLEELLGLKEE